MSLIKCPKCGEMFSDSYKTCPFCEEDEAYYSGKLRKSRGRRAAESRPPQGAQHPGPRGRHCSDPAGGAGGVADLRRP